MLEIIAVFLLARRISTMARRKGYPGSWGALTLLWFAGEFLFMFFAVGAGLPQMTVYLIGLLGAAAGGGTAYLIVQGMNNAPGWVDGMQWAGYCRKCKTNVWMTPDATRCLNGHPASAVKKWYRPDTQPSTEAPEEGPTPPRA